MQRSTHCAAFYTRKDVKQIELTLKKRLRKKVKYK